MFFDDVRVTLTTFERGCRVVEVSASARTSEAAANAIALTQSAILRANAAVPPPVKTAKKTK